MKSAEQKRVEKDLEALEGARLVLRRMIYQARSLRVEPDADTVKAFETIERIMDELEGQE